MKKLFLLDAYAIIYRSYYALIKSPRVNSKGLNTSAIMGFVNTLNEVLDKEKADYIAVAFDHGKTFRHEAYPPYKAQREETPETIRESVPIIKNILKAYNVTMLQADGFEADDIIGTVARKAAEEGLEVYMLTPDKDYAQLVADNIYMYRPKHGGGYDKLGVEEVKAKYAIGSPAQVIDLLALMGDTADNYPGCPGVGEKTAAKLIAQFGTVDNLLEKTSELKGKLKEKVEAAKDDIKTSYFLATIRTDVPMDDLDIADMAVKEPDTEDLNKIFTELEFKTFKDRILKKYKKEQNNANTELDIFAEKTDGTSNDSKSTSFESLKTVEHNYKLIDNEDDMRKLCDFLLTNKIVSLDTETTSTSEIDAELVGMSFAVKEFEAWYVAVPAEKQKAQNIVNIFKPLYENSNILKVGQNIKYDYEVLMNYGVTIQGPMFDTMLAHYLIQPELHHNMDYLAEVYLNYTTVHIERVDRSERKKTEKHARPRP